MANASPEVVASKYAKAKAAKVDPKKVGFERPEMHSLPLVGTVKYYEQHVFLTASDGKKWPAKVEKSAAGGLPARLAAAISQQGGNKKTNFLLCDASEGAEGDVLIFPDMKKYRLQPSDDVAAFVRSALQSETESAPPSEPITGSHVFICTHNSRDARCGYSGPVLIEAFKKAIGERGLSGKVHVRGCSHVGGHKYAGNLIIYQERDGRVEGDWYGYVSPEDVPALLEQHVEKGAIVEKLWRGRMGLTEDQQKAELKRLASSREAQPSGTAGGTCQDCDCGKAEGKMEAASSTSVYDSAAKGGRDALEKKSSFSQWVPAALQKVDRRDAAIGAAAVVSISVLLIWLNLHRRGNQQ